MMAWGLAVLLCVEGVALLYYPSLSRWAGLWKQTPKPWYSVGGHLIVFSSTLETDIQVLVFWFVFFFWIFEQCLLLSPCILGFSGPWRYLPDTSCPVMHFSAVVQLLLWAAAGSWCPRRWHSAQGCCRREILVHSCFSAPGFSFVFTPLKLRRSHRSCELIINFVSCVNSLWKFKN